MNDEPTIHCVNCICSQCGQTWDKWACGLTHAIIRREIENGAAVIECKHPQHDPPDDHNPMADFFEAIKTPPVMPGGPND